MKCLGLDIGSSTIKGAVLDLARRTVGDTVRESFPAPVAGLPIGHFEVDPAAVCVAVERVVMQLLNGTPDCAALYCSGQMGGVILVDPTGRALTNYLSWRDQRTLEPCGGHSSYLDAIRARWGERILGDVGNELATGSATGLLFWLAENGQLPQSAMPATIADYVIGQLCHSAPHMHETQAVGLWDMRSADVHREAFSKLGLDAIRWPKIADLRVPVGEFSRGTQRPVACFASIGDQQCALRGVGLTRNELSINISTGSQISRRTERFEPGEYQTRKYFDGDFLNTITHLPAGRSLNVLMDLLTELPRTAGIPLANSWDLVARLVEAAPPTDLQVNLAFFAGPLGTTGSVNGITTENLTVGRLFQSAFRAMAENYAVCAERLGRNESCQQLALSGGLTQSFPVLQRLICERVGMPARESTNGEETLAGLLDIAGDCGDKT